MLAGWLISKLTKQGESNLGKGVASKKRRDNEKDAEHGD